MTMAKGTPKWAPEEDADLRRMWDEEGLSSGDIAFVMGRTRNAVIARANRLVLTKRSSIRTQPRIKPRKKRDISTYYRKSKLLPVALPGDTRPLRGAVWEPLPGTTPVSLVDLAAGMCKWPIGEAKPYLFCGDRADRSYCEYHRAVSVGAAHKWKEAA